MKQIILSSVFLATLACAEIDVGEPPGDGDGDVQGDGDVEASGGAEDGSGGEQEQGSGGRSSGGQTGDGDGDGDGDGGSGTGGVVTSSGGAPGSGGASGSGGAVSTGGASSGGASGSGGALGTGGASVGACTKVTCGGQVEPDGDECFEFATTSAFSGWQVSNNQGCSITFDDAAVPAATVQMQFGAGTHTLEFAGCTNPDISWGCWGN